jgi:HEAT repeat protein
LRIYFEDRLSGGDRLTVERKIRERPTRLGPVLELLGDPATAINVRVGAGAVLESLEGSGLLEGVVADLGALTRHHDARIRADGCHYLCLTRSQAAMPYLRSCLDDEDGDVREIARESIQVLSG